MTDLEILDRATRAVIESSEGSRISARHYARHGTTSEAKWGIKPILFQRIRWQYELMLAGAGGIK